MRKILTIVVIFAIISAGIIYFFSQNKPSNPTLTDQQDEHIYTNSKHGYSLVIPKRLQIKEYSTDNVVIGNISGERVEGIHEVRTMMVKGELGKTLRESTADQLIPLCAADSPSITFMCTQVVQVQPVHTVSGLGGHALYLEGELTNLQTNETTTKGKGPFFVFPLATGATMSKVLVIHAPLNLYTDETDSETIRNVALSLKVQDTIGDDTTDVERYISEHISELSTEKEQLGGTFYVTDMQVSNGSGTVSYEDGHNAYTADFTFTTAEDGTIVIPSFTVR